MTAAQKIKQAEERLDEALKNLKAAADRAKAGLEALAADVSQKLG